MRRGLMVGLKFRWATPVVLGAAACVAATAAQADTLRVRYSVTLVGLSLGTASLAASLNPGHYKIEAAARLTGIASLVSNSKGVAISTGGFAPGKPLPATYATTSSSSQMTRTVRMALNAGSVRGVDISPPIDEAPDRIPVTDRQKRGVIDPLSALLMPVPGDAPAVGPASCNRTIPVYDGFTRFDVPLTFEGVRQAEAQGYAGPVAVCSARYVPISGHRPTRQVTQFMANNRDMEVWLAPVGRTRILAPFRISVATLVGTTVIEAQEFAVSAGRVSRSAKR
jgi:hypothetical protein